MCIVLQLPQWCNTQFPLLAPPPLYPVGLLCVQELPAERPTMSLVLRMLSGDVTVPSPKQAAFFVGRAPRLPADDNNTESGNQLTYTDLQGR